MVVPVIVCLVFPKGLQADPAADDCQGSKAVEHSCFDTRFELDTCSLGSLVQRLTQTGFVESCKIAQCPPLRVPSDCIFHELCSEAARWR